MMNIRSTRRHLTIINIHSNNKIPRIPRILNKIKNIQHNSITKKVIEIPKSLLFTRAKLGNDLIISIVRKEV